VSRKRPQGDASKGKKALAQRLMRIRLILFSPALLGREDERTRGRAVVFAKDDAAHRARFKRAYSACTSSSNGRGAHEDDGRCARERAEYSGIPPSQISPSKMPTAYLLVPPRRGRRGPPVLLAARERFSNEPSRAADLPQTRLRRRDRCISPANVRELPPIDSSSTSILHGFLHTAVENTARRTNSGELCAQRHVGDSMPFRGACRRVYTSRRCCSPCLLSCVIIN